MSTNCLVPPRRIPWTADTSNVGRRCNCHPNETYQSMTDRALAPPPMRFDQLVALLPCQSLETFDLDRKEEDAEQLLSAWSALWHPALLADAKMITAETLADAAKKAVAAAKG